jgi:hypothetical protein
LHCGCPDCSKPHPPHFQHNYCENLANSTESVEETEAEAEAAVDSSASKDIGGTQTASRLFSPIAFIAAAAAVALIAAAFVMRKRVSLL